MKKAIFILKPNSNGTKYGIGTYTSNLVKCLMDYPDLDIYLISINSAKKEFEVIQASSNYFEIFIPNPQNRISSERDKQMYINAIDILLSPYISKYKEFVFHSNIYADFDLLKRLKEHVNCKILAVVHYSIEQDVVAGHNYSLEELVLSSNTPTVLENEKGYFHFVDHIVCLSKPTQDLLIKRHGINPSKITIIPNGIEVNEDFNLSLKDRLILKREMGYRDDEKIVIFVGRLEKKKGVYDLLRAFQYITNRDPDYKVRLVLIGDGNFSEFFSELSLQYGKITVTGFLSHDDLLKFYQIADLGILPSYSEQFPYSILEMASVKIPLIISRIQNLEELLTEEECTFINPEYNQDGDIFFNAENFGVEIRNLLDHPVKASAQAYNTFQKVKMRYNLGNMKKRLFRIYDSM